MKYRIMFALVLFMMAFSSIAIAQSYTVKNQKGKDKILSDLAVFEKDPLAKESKSIAKKLFKFIAESPDIGVVDCNLVALGNKDIDAQIATAMTLGKLGHTVRNNQESPRLLPVYFSLDTQLAGVKFAIAIYGKVKDPNSPTISDLEFLTSLGEKELSEEIGRRLTKQGCALS